MNRRPDLHLIAPSASPAETAAVVAALERFMRDTAPPRVETVAAPDPWRRTALLEAIGDELRPDAWGDAHPWGLNT